MKILYFAPRFPLPVTGGDLLLTERYLRYLGPRAEVHFACFDEGEPVDSGRRDELRSACSLQEVQVFPLRRVRYWGMMRHLGRGSPLQLGYYEDARARQAFEEMVLRIRPDVVLIQTVRLLPYLDLVRDAACVVHFVDALSANFHRNAKIAHSQLYRTLFAYEGRTLRGVEQRALRRADATFVVSERDAALLNEMRAPTSPEVEVIPNGVDADYFAFEPMPTEPRYRIGLFGNMVSRANEDAAVWFAREVLPHLEEALGREVVFHIIGANPKPRVQRLHSSRVRVSGSVDDLRPLVWSCDLTVAPMRVATGIQNKLLESLALGRPVVASSLCVDGLGGGPPPGILVADGVAATVARIRAFYDDYEKHRRDAPIARAAVTDQFTWEKYLDGLLLRLEALERARSRRSDSLSAA